jgi:transcriptional/translational regulatory protein YebC/TACO1
MGRIFEVRKHAMFARWNRMAKQFARIGKDITIAGQGRRHRSELQFPPAPRDAERSAVNMPKDKVEAAIRRASARTPRASTW